MRVGAQREPLPTTPNGLVTTGDDRVTLRLDGRDVATRGFDELRALYRVLAGSDLTASDDEFWAALFDGEIWVLPMDGEGVAEVLFGSWYERLCASSLFHEAALEVIPWPWRRRLLGFLPVPAPRLFRHEGSAPDWDVRPAGDFADVPRPMLRATDRGE